MMASDGIAGGGNPGGFNISDFGSARTGALSGGPHTPLMPAPFPSGQNMPSLFGNLWPGPPSGGTSTLPVNNTGIPWKTSGSMPMGGGSTGALNGGTGSLSTFPANTGGTNPTNLGGGSDNAGNQYGFNAQPINSITQGFKNAGFSKGLAGLLTQFLQSGAGFNPQIAQALINAMQPQVARGQANIQEQFGAEGLGMSSPAAIGMGDFLSQVNLNEQQIFAQMQEQATQNYMNVLLSGKVQPKQPSGTGALLGGMGSLAQSIPGLAGMFGGAGGGAMDIGSTLFGALGGGAGAAAGGADAIMSALPDLLPLLAM